MSRSTVKIGCSLGFTGEEHVHADFQFKAMEMAIGELAPHVNLEVSLVPVDDCASADGARRATEDLIRDQDVVVVVGPMGSAAAVVAAPIYQAAGLPFLTYTASRVDTVFDGNTCFFRSIPNDGIHATALAGFILRHLQAIRIVLIDDGGSFSTGLNKLTFDTLLEVKNGCLQTRSFSISTYSDHELPDICKEVSGFDPDCVLLTGMEPVCVRIAQGLRQSGVIAPFLGTDALKPSRFLWTPDYPVEGPYQSNVCASELEDGKFRAFFDRLETFAGNRYPVYTVEAYEAVQIVLQALGDARGPQARDSMREAMRHGKFRTIKGDIWFDARGESNRDHIPFFKMDSFGNLHRLNGQTNPPQTGLV